MKSLREMMNLDLFYEMIELSSIEFNFKILKWVEF